MTCRRLWLAACLLGAWLSPALGAEAHPVLDRIAQRGHIVIAHRESSVPLSYVDAKGQALGYAVDLCLRIAEAVRKALDLKSLGVQYHLVTPANRMAAIIEGQADLECGSTTNNAERRKSVAFTVPHYITGARYLVRADSPIDDLNGFGGKRLVSTKGTTPMRAIDQANRERLLRITILEAADHAQALQMVEQGQADGFAMDDVLLYGLIASAPDPSRFKVVGKFLTIEPLAIMLSKDDPAFKQIVDAEMRRLILSGEAQRIYDKWFMRPIPPKGQNLNVPMSYLLKDFWKYPTDQVPF
ncbi:amino acid ABC transporter substrate-binding protein [Caldimonas sp.]|uniref:amino acid ABC transporter substrate-binding protein n=1 Tax=Caldimonas sp. TaxID=2838790 RepID=UPI0029D80B3D|nr:amino acid ABC transporter substrate-binding protein [Caldimonas manganoxidans]